jgi:hypothetical protein
MPAQFTIKGETSTQTYPAAYRHRWADNTRFGKTHLVIRLHCNGDVDTLCGSTFNDGIFADYFDVYNETATCNQCRKISLL